MYLAIGFNLGFGLIWHCSIEKMETAQVVARKLSKEIKNCCREAKPLWPDTILFIENGSNIVNTKGAIIKQESPDVLFRWSKGVDFDE